MGPDWNGLQAGKGKRIKERPEGSQFLSIADVLVPQCCYALSALHHQRHTLTSCRSDEQTTFRAAFLVARPDFVGNSKSLPSNLSGYTATTRMNTGRKRDAHRLQPPITRTTGYTAMLFICNYLKPEVAV